MIFWKKKIYWNCSDFEPKGGFGVKAKNLLFFKFSKFLEIKSKKTLKIGVFFQDSYFFILNLNSTCFSFLLRNMTCVLLKIFEFSFSLAMKFPWKPNFLPRPLATKIIIKGDFFDIYGQLKTKISNWDQF